MKASSLTGSIKNVLNEDAYENLTIRQLYLKLGQRGCFRYVKSLCQNIIQREGSEFLSGMKPDDKWSSATPDGRLCVVYFTAKRGSYYDGLKISFGQDTDLEVTGMIHDKDNLPSAQSDTIIISRNTPDIYEPLKKAIKKVFKSVRLDKWRKKLNR